LCFNYIHKFRDYVFHKFFYYVFHVVHKHRYNIFNKLENHNVNINFDKLNDFKNNFVYIVYKLKFKHFFHINVHFN
ncbi:hypothetical protein HDU99_006778, partial [Rhizoclosmatium hyalinum]